MDDLERQFLSALANNPPGLVEALRNEARGQVETDQPSHCANLLVAAADAIETLSTINPRSEEGGEGMDDTENQPGTEKPEGEEAPATGGEAEGDEQPAGGEADTQTND